MASWRRKALALFPDLKFEVQRPDFSVYQVFFRILPMSRDAHKAGDVDTLRKIYDFAEWCFEQRAKEMWNAAGVAFYEHLFDDHPSLWAKVCSGSRRGLSSVAWGCGDGGCRPTISPQLRS